MQIEVEKKIKNKEKAKWLTDEKLIQSVWENERLVDRYLNDTRSSTRIIRNYLEHYLYPRKNRYGKGESSQVITITGKAIKELKYIWGISEVEPKNIEGKKDRETNYHHTVDAIAISMAGVGARNILHTYFKEKQENNVKNKILYEKLKNSYPHHKKGYSIVAHVKELVEKYEKNEIYVCPMYKYKENQEGFNLGNNKLKNLVIDNKEYLVEFKKVNINVNLFYADESKVVGKRKSESALDKRFESIIERLVEKKQDNIKNALLKYKKDTSELLNEKESLEINLKKEIEKLENKKEENEAIIKIKEELKSLLVEINKPPHFLTKKGEKQIFKNLSLPLVNNKKDGKIDFKKTSADVLYVTDKNYKKERLVRLNSSMLKKLKKDKIPYCAKENKGTLSVDLINGKEGQIVGLNYFASIANEISTKINPKKEKQISKEGNTINIKKFDILKIENGNDDNIEYAVFNGGGNISNTNNGVQNNIKTKEINIKKQNPKTLNKKNKVISVVKIDFYGNIIED